MTRGFTLIEIVVVIAIFAILASLGLFMSMETLRGTLNRSEQATIVSLLERARSRAMNNINQSSWGVCYSVPNYLIIKGAVCTAAQDTIAANPGVSISSFPVVVFTQLSGTSTPAQIVMQQDGRISTTTINNEGTIIW